MEEKIKSTQSKCKACGANLYFCPNSQDLACEKCGNHYPIINDGTIETHELFKENVQAQEKHDKYVEKNKVFKCPNCGANVILNTYEISKSCPYCGTNLVIDTDVLPGNKPDACIPFVFDEASASEKFAIGIKKKFWAPRKFKKGIPQNQIKGIYIPSFAYDLDTVSIYRGRLYNESTHTDSDGHSHTERNYFSISGTHTSRFEDEIVECSSKMNQRDIMGVLPFNHSEQKAYTNEYILGYSVEHYDKNAIDSYPICKTIVDGKIRNQILRKYSYDGVDYLNVNSEYSNQKYRYYLLPVYRFDYIYKNKHYITYMNGQTGRVDNNVPKSRFKIFLAILLPILFVLAFILLPIILNH